MGQVESQRPPDTLYEVSEHLVQLSSPAALDVPAAHIVQVAPLPAYPAVHWQEPLLKRVAFGSHVVSD